MAKRSEEEQIAKCCYPLRTVSSSRHHMDCCYTTGLLRSTDLEPRVAPWNFRKVLEKTDILNTRTNREVALERIAQKSMSIDWTLGYSYSLVSTLDLQVNLSVIWLTKYLKFRPRPQDPFHQTVLVFCDSIYRSILIECLKALSRSSVSI